MSEVWATATLASPRAPCMQTCSSLMALLPIFQFLPPADKRSTPLLPHLRRCQADGSCLSGCKRGQIPSPPSRASGPRFLPLAKVILSARRLRSIPRRLAIDSVRVPRRSFPPERARWPLLPGPTIATPPPTNWVLRYADGRFQSSLQGDWDDRGSLKKQSLAIGTSTDQ